MSGSPQEVEGTFSGISSEALALLSQFQPSTSGARRSTLQVRDVEEAVSDDGEQEDTHQRDADLKAAANSMSGEAPPQFGNSGSRPGSMVDMVKLVDFLQMSNLLSAVNDALQDFTSNIRGFKKAHDADRSLSPGASTLTVPHSTPQSAKGPVSIANVSKSIAADKAPSALTELALHVDVLMQRVETMSEELSKASKRAAKPYGGSMENTFAGTRFQSSRGGITNFGNTIINIHASSRAITGLPRPESKLPPAVPTNFAAFEKFCSPFGDPPERPFGEGSRVNSAASLNGQEQYPDAVTTDEVHIDKDAEGNKVINNYIVIGQLGRGMYGKVKLAEHRSTHQTVALKVLNKSLLRKMKHGGTSGMQQVQAEIAIMKKLRHRNVVGLFEVIDDPGSNKLYLVMQYIAKGAIMKLREDGSCSPLQEETVRDYARQLASGLTYLHRNNIVHRDIKPDNILLDNEDNVYLADFGVSEILDSDGDGMVTGSQGTPAFFSPELCRGEGSVHGKAVDIWALGVTLFVLLYGYLPFFGDGVEDMMSNIQNCSLQFPADADPDWKQLLLQMLNKDPNKRITALDLKHHPMICGSVATPRPAQSPAGGTEGMGMRRCRGSDFDLLTIDENDLNNAITYGAGIELQLHQTPHDRIMKFVDRVREKVRRKKEQDDVRATMASPNGNMRKPAPPAECNNLPLAPRSRGSVRIEVPNGLSSPTLPQQKASSGPADDAPARFSQAVERIGNPAGSASPASPTSRKSSS